MTAESIVSGRHTTGSQCRNEISSVEKILKYISSPLCVHLEPTPRDRHSFPDRDPSLSEFSFFSRTQVIAFISCDEKKEISSCVNRRLRIRGALTLIDTNAYRQEHADRLRNVRGRVRGESSRAAAREE